MDYFGYQTVGSVSGIILSNQENAYGPFVITENGVVGELGIFATSGSGHVKLALYADASGAPGSLIDYTDPIAVSGTPDWIHAPGVMSAPIVSGQSYWISMICDTGYSMAYDVGTEYSVWYDLGRNYTTQPSDPCGAMTGLITGLCQTCRVGVVSTIPPVAARRRKLLLSGAA